MDERMKKRRSRRLATANFVFNVVFRILNAELIGYPYNFYNTLYCISIKNSESEIKDVDESRKKK